MVVYEFALIFFFNSIGNILSLFVVGCFFLSLFLVFSVDCHLLYLFVSEHSFFGLSSLIYIELIAFISIIFVSLINKIILYFVPLSYIMNNNNYIYVFFYHMCDIKMII